MADADSEDGSGRSVCTEVELIARHLDECMDKPDFLVYKNDLSKNPGSGDVDKKALLQKSAMKIAMQIKERVSPNLSLGKLACENAIGYLVDEKAKGGKAPWNLIENDARKRYYTDMAAKVRTLCKHVASLYRRKGGPPRWYKRGLVKEGFAEPEDDEEDDEEDDDTPSVRKGKPAAKTAEEAEEEEEEEEEPEKHVRKRPAAKDDASKKPAGMQPDDPATIRYVFKYNEYTFTALRINTKTCREEAADETIGPEGDFMIAKWKDGTTWKYPKELADHQKEGASHDLPHHDLPCGGQVFFKMKRDRSNFRLILITKVKKDKTLEQQTQINCRYFENEKAGIKVMEQRILSMFIRNPNTTKQEAMAEKMTLEKELKELEKEKKENQPAEAQAIGAGSSGAAPARKRPAAAASIDAGATGNGEGEDADTAPEDAEEEKAEPKAEDRATPKGKKRAAVGSEVKVEKGLQRMKIDKGIVEKKVPPKTPPTTPPTMSRAAPPTAPPTTQMQDAQKRLAESDSSAEEAGELVD